MEILENYSLKNHNTFGINAKCNYYVSIRNEDEIEEIINTDVFQKNKFFILGGGSNILFADDFKGLVIDINIRGIKIIDSKEDTVIIEAGAGEYWDDFITLCLNNKFYGLENLTLIPGKVGAAPVQNIGAYGIEQKDFFYSLSGFNIESRKYDTLSFNDCHFKYRDSVFKNEFKNNFIITQVRYNLYKKEKLNLTYKELADDILKNNIEKPDARIVYDTVRKLRTSKLPDFRLYGNAGSFFKNPVISNKRFKLLKEKYSDIKSYNMPDDKVKIPAGWLIEQCGWKGKRIGNAGISEKHALILVNYGNATGNDILELGNQINNSVKDKFDIVLEYEVLIIK